MSEYEEMRGRLSGLEQEAYNLRMTIDGLCRAIRREINSEGLDPEDIDDLNIPMAAQQMRNLEAEYTKLLGVSSRIKRLKKELGLG